MSQELYELYKRNSLFIVRAKETVLQILQNKENITIEHRDEHKNLIGASVVNQNALLLLCVDATYRNRGIGSELLAKSEDVVKANGYDTIVVGNGFDYISPGVPTAKRYFDAENEALYPGLNESASDFFTRRGYTHSWGCNCFDMRLSLEELGKETYSVGDTVDGVTYRWATMDDLAQVHACTDDAFPEFTIFYRQEKLYAPDSDTKVLIAVTQGKVVGTLIVEPQDRTTLLGSVGCTTVRPAFRGKHIAVNLVAIGTKHLKDIGLKDAFLGYTYTGLDHVYGYAGYKICCYFMMAQKVLG